MQSEYLKISVTEDILEETEDKASHNYYRRERSVSESSRMIKLPYLINKKDRKSYLSKWCIRNSCPKASARNMIFYPSINLQVNVF